MNHGIDIIITHTDAKTSLPKTHRCNVNIYINREKIAERITPGSIHWVNYELHIPPKHIKKGINEIKIVYQMGGQSQYWIQSVKIVPSHLHVIDQVKQLMDSHLQMVYDAEEIQEHIMKPHHAVLPDQAESYQQELDSRDTSPVSFR